MTIIELIEKVGLENVTLQPLERDLQSVQTSKKQKCTLITFGTHAITPTDIVIDNPSRKVGFVLWFPKDKLPSVDSERQSPENKAS